MCAYRSVVFSPYFGTLEYEMTTALSGIISQLGLQLQQLGHFFCYLSMQNTEECTRTTHVHTLSLVSPTEISLGQRAVRLTQLKCLLKSTKTDITWFPYEEYAEVSGIVPVLPALFLSSVVSRLPLELLSVPVQRTLPFYEHKAQES